MIARTLDINEEPLVHVASWVFLEPPETIDSHYVRLLVEPYPRRTGPVHRPLPGRMVAYGNLRADTPNRSPVAHHGGTEFMRPILWLRTADYPTDTFAGDPYDPTYWPAEGVRVAEIVDRWPIALRAAA